MKLKTLANEIEYISLYLYIYTHTHIQICMSICMYREKLRKKESCHPAAIEWWVPGIKFSLMREMRGKWDELTQANEKESK